MDRRWYQMNIFPYILLQAKKTEGVIVTFVEITAMIEELRVQKKLVADYEILIRFVTTLKIP